MVDTATLIDNRIKDHQDLYARMDDTRDRVYNTPYALKNAKGEKIDTAIHVTMPYAAIMANTIINDMMDAKRQTVVEGDVPHRIKNTVESFLTDMRAQIDEQLLNSGQYPLFDWWCNHVAIRSYIGIRYISQIEGGKFSVDPLLLDMRWCPHRFGRDGLLWACARMHKTRDEIIDLWPEAKDKVSDEKEQEVRDFWDREKNEVLVGPKDAAKTLVFQQKNPFGYPPFVIAAPATGFMLRDQGYIAHESEDILYLLRGVLDEMNRSASIEQTLGMESLTPPMQYETQAFDAKPADKAPKTGQVAKRKAGELFREVPRKDINQAFVSGRADLEQVRQMGGVNDIDLGNVSQTVSAVWITAQTGIRKKFTNPRLKTIARAESLLARMIIDQYQKAGSGETRIGAAGRKRVYTGVDLGDPERYSVTYDLMAWSATEEIANLAQFNAAAQELPLRWRLEKILKVGNPDALMRERDIEEARKADPAIALFDMAMQAAEEAAETEDEKEADALKIQSMLLTERCVAIITQRQQPTAMPQAAAFPQQEKPKVNNSLSGLLGIGGQMAQPRGVQA